MYGFVCVSESVLQHEGWGCLSLTSILLETVSVYLYCSLLVFKFPSTLPFCFTSTGTQTCAAPSGFIWVLGCKPRPSHVHGEHSPYPVTVFPSLGCSFFPWGVCFTFPFSLWGWTPRLARQLLRIVLQCCNRHWCSDVSVVSHLGSLCVYTHEW